MDIETIELRFPDGEFEIDTTDRVPQVGEVVTRNGRVWKVDAIEPGIPTVVVMQAAPIAPDGEDPR
jgi:hypothetical protein